MHFKSLLVVTATLTALLPSSASAVPIVYEFRAQLNGLPPISSPIGQPYGVPFINQNVVGRFAYDPDAPSVYIYPHPPYSTQGQFHQVPGGFQGDLGGISTRADQYVIRVLNNYATSEGPRDIVFVEYDPSYVPITAPLSYAGVDRDECLFYFRLTGTSEMLTGDPLNPIDATQLLGGWGGLFDDSHRGQDIVGISLTRVPEPSTVALAAVGLLALAGVALRRARRAG